MKRPIANMNGATLVAIADKLIIAVADNRAAARKRAKFDALEENMRAKARALIVDGSSEMRARDDDTPVTFQSRRDRMHPDRATMRRLSTRRR